MLLHLELYHRLVIHLWIKVSMVLLLDQCVQHAGGQEMIGLALVEE